MQILHGDERFAVFFSDIMNGADVGMAERRGGLRFSLEAPQCLRILRHIVRQELQRNETVQPYILGL